MVLAYVLISTAPGREHDVYRRLTAMDGMLEVTPLFGEYDLIVKLDAGSFDDVGKVVIERIRSVPGVQDTRTLATMNLRP